MLVTIYIKRQHQVWLDEQAQLTGKNYSQIIQDLISEYSSSKRDSIAEEIEKTKRMREELEKKEKELILVKTMQEKETELTKQDIIELWQRSERAKYTDEQNIAWLEGQIKRLQRIGLSIEEALNWLKGVQ